MAGAIVYWRAGERQRAQRGRDEVDDAIGEGRQAASALLQRGDATAESFDQR